MKTAVSTKKFKTRFGDWLLLLSSEHTRTLTTTTATQSAQKLNNCNVIKQSPDLSLAQNVRLLCSLLRQCNHKHDSVVATQSSAAGGRGRSASPAGTRPTGCDSHSGQPGAFCLTPSLLSPTGADQPGVPPGPTHGSGVGLRSLLLGCGSTPVRPEAFQVGPSSLNNADYCEWR